ncbi:MAG: sigma-70 family RNA polymerase sigma factor [Planctomycetota bacterium]
MSTLAVPSILDRVAAEESSAFEECMDRFGGLVWSIARRLSSSREDAEDAVQEVFLDVWKNADRFDARQGSETTFIVMIGRRRCIDRMRKRGRQINTAPLETGFEVAETEDLGFDEVIRNDEVEHVSQFLTSLKPEQQRILELSVYEGMSHSEISEELGLPLGTVKTHLRRGLIEVRRRVASRRATQRRWGGRPLEGVA